LNFDPKNRGRSIPSVVAKIEAHGPTFFFAVFTRIRIYLNSQ